MEQKLILSGDRFSATVASPVRRERALLKAGALQNAILNSANFSSIATDEEGVIQIFNVGAERMLGYASDAGDGRQRNGGMVASNDPNLKILFSSGYTDDAISHHGVLMAGIEFIPKPYTPSALVRKVRELLDQPALPRLEATQGRTRSATLPDSKSAELLTHPTRHD